MNLEKLTDLIKELDSDPNQPKNGWTSEEYAKELLDRLDTMPEQYVFMGKATVEETDDGVTKILEVIDDYELDHDNEVGLFVRVLSWDPEKRHVAAKPLEGQTLRITVEVGAD
jgi:hypothetical protein